jgi:hypothetical protein
MKATTYYEEAIRYVNNARKILKEVPVKDKEYTDIKRVKMAAGVAYARVDIAAKWFIKYKNPKAVIKGDTDITRELRKLDKKAVNLYSRAWLLLHKGSYYHTSGVDVVTDASIDSAEDFISSLHLKGFKGEPSYKINGIH